MSKFPQIGEGSIAQFPIKRTLKWRLLENRLEGGERIVLPDHAAAEIQWSLPFIDLSDEEAAKIMDLFESSQGQFRAFTFIDPLANLLGWSGDLTQADWQTSLLQVSGGVNDPIGTQKAWSLLNSTPGVQNLQQTREVPGDYVTCFSTWVRSDAPGALTLARDGVGDAKRIGPAWSRISTAGQGTSGAEQSSFSIAIGPGQTIQVWGLQVEAQPCCSSYKQTRSAAGVYAESYFATDELKVTNTGLGRSSCEILLLSRVLEEGS